MNITELEGFGRTISVRFTCYRCRKAEFLSLKSCLPKDGPIRNLSDLETPPGWRNGGFYYPTFCPECAKKYDRFMNGEELRKDVTYEETI